MYEKLKQIDSKELQLPETTFIRDIESSVFQAITLQCMAKIEGIGLIEGGLFDSLLGREADIKGIHVEQDQENHSVSIRVEINIRYGISIPDKAEEIQNKIVEEISDLTGLHVSCVHVVFKSLLSTEQHEEQPKVEERKEEAALIGQESDEYSDGF